jgi:NAD(P)H-hydrate epimerase
MKVTSVLEMRNLDNRAVKEYGIPELILMENAGNSIFHLIQNEIKIMDKKFLILCGPGNNGGDGMVLARKIFSNKGNVKLTLLSDEVNLQGITKKNYEILKKTKIDIKNKPSLKSIKSLINKSDVIVDGMLGTGLKGNIKGLYKDVIQFLNESNKTVICVDIPSGINGDTGEVMGSAVKSNFTVTFGLPKIGNLLYPGAYHCGRLIVSHISFPPSLYEDNSLKISINELIPLKERGKDTHKGSFGKSLFISGSRKYLGAPYFSAFAFLKAGGGLSYLATPKSISSFIARKGREMVLIPLEETEAGSISLKNKRELIKFVENVDFVVLGPGLSLNDETCKLVCELTHKIKKPLLLDGDGLTAIKDNLNIIKKRKYPTILTPHPGEFGRLINKSVEEIKKNRIKFVQNYTKELKSIIVLKGAHSLVGFPNRRVFINMTGNPGMATAGSGDVLTGTIAALYGIFQSQKESEPLESATRMGVLIHGFAGDLVTKEIGEDGLVAGDILNFIPKAMKIYRENPKEIPDSIQVI